MNPLKLITPLLAPSLIAALLALALGVHAQSTTFTYQGRLTENGAPFNGSAEFQATLWDAAGGGVPLLTNNPSLVLVGVSNGLFVLPMDFGSVPFTGGAARWLQLEVRTAIGSFSLLTPRQKVTPTPYALVAGNVTGAVASSQLTGALPSANLGGTYTGAVGFTNAANSFSGSGAGLANVNAATLQGLAASNFWRTTGNAGTAPATQFLGSIDNQPLELRVNNQRGLRLEPGANNSVNIIGGSAGNSIAAGIAGGTVAGGGAVNYFGELVTNRVASNFGTVSGGAYNEIQALSAGAVIGGGWFNTVQQSASYATIGGGTRNRIQSVADSATIAGGYQNSILPGAFQATIGGGVVNRIGNDAVGSFIGGGQDNSIGTNSFYATIAGGNQNSIPPNSDYATIAGGIYNTAAGRAFAAGNRARALHRGTFVWADGQEEDFASTGQNQFNIRASGGVGIGTGNPQGALHIYSANNPATVRVQSSGTPGFGRIEFVSDPQGSGTEWRPGYIQAADNGGFTGGLSFVVNGTGFDNRFGEVETMRLVNGRVGIGTVAPTTLLQVGNATCNGTTWINASDRNTKTGFATVDTAAMLAAVVALPVARWRYTNDPATVHVGPMAQDFRAAFGVGPDDKHIATVDADGVALAAIQGLNQKLQNTVKERDSRISALEKRLIQLEQIVASLAATKPSTL